MTARLHVVVANVYVGNPTPDRAARRIRQTGAHVGLLQEARGFPRVEDYTNLGHGPHQVATKGRRELRTLVLADARLDLQDHRMIRASRTIEGDKLAHDRHIAETYVEWQGRVVPFLNTHLNAGLQNRAGLVLRTHPRVRAAGAHMKRLGWMIQTAQREGPSPIVGGDFNWRPGTLAGWRWSPRAVARRHGLRYVNHGVDGFMYDPREWELVRWFPFVVPGSDHAGLKLVLEPR